ncbi:MAG: hypothetical protein OXN84_11240 [Albidovulum sp.]|nr:hypothetical protein [Albidovulum sp.]
MLGGGSLRRRTRRVPAENVPDGAVRGGVEYRTVREVAFFAEEVVYELEVWKLPGGGRLVPSIRLGVASGKEQYGLGLKAWIAMMQRKGQSAAGRIAEILNDICLGISRRSVVRIPFEDGAGVVAESEEILRTGMDCVSRTGTRHRAANGNCTMVGNDLTLHFGSTVSKSRLSFLEHLCAVKAGFLVNDAALGHMRRMNLMARTASFLAGHPRKRFSDAEA